jgi:hypothetical protein
VTEVGRYDRTRNVADRRSKVGVQLAARRGTQHSTDLTAREGEAAQMIE